MAGLTSTTGSRMPWKPIGFDDDLEGFARTFETSYGVSLNIGRENTIRSMQTDETLLKRVYDVFEGSMKARILEMSEDDLALYAAAESRFRS